MMTFYPNGSRPEEATATVQQPVDTTQLGTHISRCWEEAKTAKRPVEQILLASLLARDNKYTPEKLALLDPAKTSRV